MIKPGEKYGMLTTIRCVGKTPYRHEIWECRCDCGNICRRNKSSLKSSLKTGRMSSCGCYSKQFLRPQSSENNSKAGIARAIKRNKDNCNVDMLFRKGTISTNTSGAQGVSFSKSSNKWHCYVGYKGYRANLGFFQDFKDAVSVRDMALEAVKNNTFEDFFYKLRGFRLEDKLKRVLKEENTSGRND